MAAARTWPTSTLMARSCRSLSRAVALLAASRAYRRTSSGGPGSSRKTARALTALERSSIASGSAGGIASPRLIALAVPRAKTRVLMTASSILMPALE
jgi:hypothetical protein